MTKFCKTCQLQKSLSDFYVDKQKASGLTSKCKVCTIASCSSPDQVERRKKRMRAYYLARRKLKRVKLSEMQLKINKNARWASYNASKKNAEPKWLSEEQKQLIKDIYAFACWLNETVATNGDSFEVDHIVPLNGRSVKGLHVPWNLQVMEKKANCAKGNRI